jgi:hypothetical protein
MFCWFASRCTPFSCLLCLILSASPYVVSVTSGDAFVSSTVISSRRVPKFPSMPFVHTILLPKHLLRYRTQKTRKGANCEPVSGSDTAGYTSVPSMRTTDMNDHQLKSIHPRRYWTWTTILLLHVLRHLRQHHRYWHLRYFHRRHCLRRY